MDTTGNHIGGSFNASASGTDVQTTDETITGTGVNSSLHQVVISDSDLNNIGNELNGDFDSWDNQINTTQVTQSGHNAGGTYWMSESLSDSPFIHKFGNSVDGTQEISQSGSEAYSLAIGMQTGAG